MFAQFGINAGYVEDLHAKWQQSPQSVDEKWRRFFADFEAGRPVTVPPSASTSAPPPTRTNGNGAQKHNGFATTQPMSIRLDLPPHETLIPPSVVAGAESAGRVYALINAYRVRGHLYANLSPLEPPRSPGEELALETFGLTQSELDTTFPTINVAGLPERATLRDIILHLQATYCGSIGVEYTQLEQFEMRKWLRERMESTKNRGALEPAQALRILTKLTDAEIFEQFLAKNFVGEKRFSAEGAESFIAMLDVLVEESGAQGVDEIVFGLRRQ